MCGIAAVINGSTDEVSRMGHAIKHRGIKHGITEINNIKVWFSWLPIVNDKAPMQPFAVGNWTVWLNGYISNYLELADKYAIKLWTDCDTLLLTEFINLHGLSRLHELNGFFSVLAYDGAKLHAFTDRYGIKQLYQASDGNTTYICSEVKGIRAVMDLEFDHRAVGDWMYSLGIMTDHTIYKRISRIPTLHFEKPKRITIGYDQAKERLKKLFLQSIRRNKASIKDGVMLSGGVDSGIIAAHIDPEYSFSMDYIDSAFSEMENIKLSSTGKHYAVLCNKALFNSYKLKTIEVLDDLKAGSCYTNFVLTELASKHCKVIYSGAGGDEVFDGYTHRYDRAINDVIKRTGIDGPEYHHINHKDYDWMFLKGILVVEDRMSGWHTMETRYPLLDNDFVDFALSLPKEYRANKRILKDISGLPEKITQSKKRGFSNPDCTNLEWAQLAFNETCNLLHRLRNRATR